MSPIRSPFRDIGQGLGEGLQQLAQTLLEERRRAEDFARQEDLLQQQRDWAVTDRDLAHERQVDLLQMQRGWAEEDRDVTQEQLIERLLVERGFTVEDRDFQADQRMNELLMQRGWGVEDRDLAWQQRLQLHELERTGAVEDWERARDAAIEDRDVAWARTLTQRAYDLGIQLATEQRQRNWMLADRQQERDWFVEDQRHQDQLGQGQAVQQIAGSLLETGMETLGRWAQAAEQGQPIDQEAMADLGQLVEGLFGVVQSSPQDAPKALGALGPFGQQIATAAGAAAAATTATQRLAGRQDQNLTNLMERFSALPAMTNLGTNEGMAAFVAAAQGLRAMRNADFPPGTEEQVEGVFNSLDYMQQVIQNDPALQQLWDAQTALARGAVREQELSQRLLKISIRGEEVNLEIAQETLADLPAERRRAIAEDALGAWEFFQQTGLILPGFEDNVRGLYERNLGAAPDAPSFEEFQNSAFARYTSALEADAELTQLQLQIGRHEVTLAELEVDQGRYMRTRRSMDEFLMFYGSAEEMIGAALGRGDTARLNDMLAVLRNPSLNEELHRVLTGAGVTPEQLQANIERAKRTEAFQRREQELAEAEIDARFAELAEVATVRPLMAGAELRSMLASSMSPSQMESYYERLTPQQQAMIGGREGLRAAQSRAAMREELEGWEATRGAMAFVNSLANLLVEDERLDVVVESLVGELTEAGVAPAVAHAIGAGLHGSWSAGNTELGIKSTESDARVALWKAQTDEINARLAAGEMPLPEGWDLNDYRQWVGENRQLIQAELSNLQEQARQQGCVPTTSIQGLSQQGANQPGSDFRIYRADGSLRPWTSVHQDPALQTQGQISCAGVLWNIEVARLRLLELGDDMAGFMRMLAPGGTAEDWTQSGQPGTGAQSPFVGFEFGPEWNEMDLGVLHMELEFQLDNDPTFNPNDAAHVQALIDAVAEHQAVGDPARDEPPTPEPRRSYEDPRIEGTVGAVERGVTQLGEIRDENLRRLFGTDDDSLPTMIQNLFRRQPADDGEQPP